jgi:hypothetical protein
MKLKLFFTTSLLIATVGVQAGEMQFLPVLKAGYQADVAVAIVGGDMKVNDSSNTAQGLEVSLNCPLLKPANHNIRQQASFIQTDKDGVKTQSFELNPHHMLINSGKFSAGIGASLGYTKVETATDDDGVATYGAGISTRYNIVKGAFVGAEVRYVKAQGLEIAGQEEKFNNSRAVVKLGYQF